MKDWLLRLGLGAGVLIALFLVVDANAQSLADPRCIDRDTGVKALQEDAKEIRRFYAIGRNGTDLIEIFIASNGKFTITYSRAGMNTICWVIKGNNFTEEKNPFVPGEDS